MKRLLALGMCVVALGACSVFKPQPQAMRVAPAVPATAPQLVDANGAPIERVRFRVGVSTATVERMAKLQACTGGAGAGLVTEAGPVEVYRMQCDNGKVFMARCELRQCRAM